MTKSIKTEMLEALKEYGVVTHTELKFVVKDEILKSEKRTDFKLKKLERSLAIKITKSKNDLSDRIANLALAKEERNKVERIEKRVQTIENFLYA